VHLDSFGRCSPSLCNSHVLEGDGLGSVDIILQHNKTFLPGTHGGGVKIKSGGRAAESGRHFLSIDISPDVLHMHIKSNREFDIAITAGIK